MWIALLVALLAQSTDYVANGIKALDAGQHEAAAALFSKAIAADPSDYGAHFNLALVYSLEGKDAQAIPEYKKVLELHPGTYEAQLNLGMSLMNVKDAVAAIPYLKDAAAQKPAEFDPAYYLGEALLDTKHPDEAATAFATATSLKADSAPAELGFAHALVQQDRRREAEPHYRKAAQIDAAKYRDFLLELATFYEDHHENQDALNIYQEFPDNPDARERAGVLLLQSGETASAIAALEGAVAKSPTAANRVALAQAYVKEKQIAKAEPLVAQAITDAPDDFDLRLFYGRILRDQRKFPLAIEQFSTVASAKPDSVEAWSELAGLLLVTEQLSPALAAMDHVRELGAETSGHYYIRATILDKLNRYKEALEYYNKFLAADKNKNPDQEFLARQRVQAMEVHLGKR